MSIIQVKHVMASLIVCLLATLLSPYAGAQSTPAEAAEIARKQTGGKVLKVTGQQGSYKVKVLTPNSQIRWISVGNRSKGNQQPGKSKNK